MGAQNNHKSNNKANPRSYCNKLKIVLTFFLLARPDTGNGVNYKTHHRQLRATLRELDGERKRGKWGRVGWGRAGRDGTGREGWKERKEDGERREDMVQRNLVHVKILLLNVSTSSYAKTISTHSK